MNLNGISFETRRGICCSCLYSLLGCTTLVTYQILINLTPIFKHKSSPLTKKLLRLVVNATGPENEAAAAYKQVASPAPKIWLSDAENPWQVARTLLAQVQTVPDLFV